MNTLVTAEEVKKLGRPIGKVDNSKILSFITEVEQTIIRKTIGDAFYIRLIDYVGSDKKDEAIELLFNGGIYQNSKGEDVMFMGLKQAESYFVYAQNVRAGDFESTRYGMVQKNDEYSSSISAKERDSIANSVTEIGNEYLRECINYCVVKGLINKVGQSMHTTSGCVIRKIKY